MRALASIRTYLTGSFNLAISLLVSLAVTPFLVKALGDSQYGVYRVLLEWLGYLALVDAGIQEAAFTLLSRAGNQSSEHQARILSLKQLSKISWTNVPIKLAIGFLIITVAPLLEPSQAVESSQIRFALLVGLTTSLAATLLPYRVLLETQLKGYWINGLLILQTLSTGGLSVLFAWFGWGLPGQMLALSVGHGCLFLGSYLLGKMELRRNQDQTGKFANAPQLSSPSIDLEEISNFSRMGFLTELCNRIGYMSHAIILAAFLGSSAVTMFVLTQRLVQIAASQVLGIASASRIALADLQRVSGSAAFAERLCELSTLIIAIGASVLTLVFCINETFISHWIGHEFIASPLISAITAVNGLLLALVGLWAWIFTASGKQKTLLPMMLTQTALSLALALLFTHLWGSPGPLLGTFCGLIASLIFFLPNLLAREFSVSRRALFISIIRPLMFLAPLLTLAIMVKPQAEAAPWEALLFVGISFPILLATLYSIVLSENDRVRWKNRLKSILG